jgi:hypothetical protein
MPFLKKRPARWPSLTATLLAASTLLAFAASGPQNEKTPPPKASATRTVGSESYDVYSALLTQHYRGWFRQNRVVKIAAYTTVPSHGPGGNLIAQCASEAENEIDRELIKQLSSDQATPQKPEAKLTVPGRYTIVDGKADFQEGTEPGIVWLSSVAFSKDRRHAMVWVRNFCGGLCGSGMMWKLDLTVQGWRVVGSIRNCGFIS